MWYHRERVDQQAVGCTHIERRCPIDWLETPEVLREILLCMTESRHLLKRMHIQLFLEPLQWSPEVPDQHNSFEEGKNGPNHSQ